MVQKKTGSFLKNKLLLLIILGFILGISTAILSHQAIRATSTDRFCEVCHVHPHVFESWKLSNHYNTSSGIRVKCVECHLPPEGEGYLREKARLGIRDAWGYLTKDSADFNWETRRTVEKARHFTFQESCTGCHVNLFPLTLSKEGQDAHLYYDQKKNELLCLNCHIDVGHFDPNRVHTRNLNFGGMSVSGKEMFAAPAQVSKFETFTETIPNTTVSFRMMAIPGGKFRMGSPESEKMREKDEGPAREVEVTSFFMAETEVTWDEYLAFYSATAGEGRSTDTGHMKGKSEVDAVSGPTPPYGQPDQNWGMGSRPAITMTFHAAESYCKWLSQVTGKTYRLPTEAEWEYAARGGTQAPYFFDGEAADFSEKGFFRKFFGKKNDLILKYIIYNANSQGRTQEPGITEANPFGLRNMLGNAAEYCSDWYASEAYSALHDGIVNPGGPVTGNEKVVRGGSFKSDAGGVRCASRDFTRTEEWMKTDPQIPKSIWWLSDCNEVSFRVVCEFNEYTGSNQIKQ
jgi:formylglycine-generating enzyme required for sulfatase activity